MDIKPFALPDQDLIEIRVGPAAGGWQVVSTLAANSAPFLSGAQAERAAKDLGRRVAIHGLDAAVHIFDLSGAEIATWRYFAEVPESEGLRQIGPWLAASQPSDCTDSCNSR